MTRIVILLASVSMLQAGDTPRLDATQREETVGRISALLAERYLDESVGKRLAGVLRARLERGDFASLVHPDAFAAAMTDLLQRETSDRHLWIFHRDGAVARLQFAAFEGPMVGRTEVLPGDIGYVEL